jgi:hypothetical protein
VKLGDAMETAGMSVLASRLKLQDPAVVQLQAVADCTIP